MQFTTILMEKMMFLSNYLLRVATKVKHAITVTATNNTTRIVSDKGRDLIAISFNL